MVYGSHQYCRRAPTNTVDVQACKIAYEAIVARMTEELNRFQKERAAEMGALLRDFALAQAGVGARVGCCATTDGPSRC